MRLYWADATCDVILIFLSSVFLFPSFSVFLPYSAELLNCPFSELPNCKTCPEATPRVTAGNRDGEREKTRDERSAALIPLEENIVTLISPLLILTPNVGAINIRYHILGGCWTHFLPTRISSLGTRVGFSIQTVVCPGKTLPGGNGCNFKVTRTIFVGRSTKINAPESGQQNPQSSLRYK